MFKRNFKTSVIMLVSITIIIYGVVTVNVYNTKALSAKGEKEENYKIISDEFGEEFSDFIKDKAPLKIYLGEANDGESTVKVLNKKINLTANNAFYIYFKSAYKIWENTINNIIEKFKNKEVDNNSIEIKDNNINNEEDINNIVDDFIKSQNND